MTSKAIAPIPLPYNLVHDELVLETAPSVETADLWSELNWLSRNVCDQHEAERIFRAAVVLHNAVKGDFAQSLRTAILWERG